MARDVEEAKKTFRVERMPPSAELIDKTAEVRAREVERTAEPVEGQARREERKLEEILHEARRRIEVPPVRPKKTLEDMLPIEEKIARPLPLEVLPASPLGGPPPDLPVLSTTPPPEPPRAVKEMALETPEEILGLPRAPVVPLPPLVPLPKPPTPQKKLRGLPSLKFALFAGFLSVILIAIAFGLYFTIFADKRASLAPQPEQKIIEQPLPKALLRYDQVKFIEIRELSYGALKPAIEALQDVVFPAGTLLYIPIKYSSEKEIRYLGAEEFFRILQIDVPAPIALAKDFSLFLYTPPTGQAGQPDAGPRLGFVMAAPEIDTSVMEEWEKTIVEDLRSLIFGTTKREEGALFRRGSYKDVETHFINLPIPTTSVDWIMTGAHLVVATSKDAARAAVDKVDEASQ